MATEKPTLLLIGGGWHTPHSYSKLTAQLESAGFDVHVPALPTVDAAQPPKADLYIDSAHVRSVAQELADNGREFIVLMHSYGGQVGTNALHGLGLEKRKQDGKTGGISNLIYMTASASLEGKSMVDTVKHFGHLDLMPMAMDFADDMSCLCRDPKMLLVGETDLPTAEVDEYLATFVRWNGQTMHQPLNTPRAPWRDIPVTYIYTMKDMLLPYDYQKFSVDGMAKEGVEAQIATLETGHCPNFTTAKEVADIVLKVAKGEPVGANSEASKGTTKDDVRDVVQKLASEAQQ
jgi:pimeloyl-ACP methyl ester carboxylesterase